MSRALNIVGGLCFGAAGLRILGLSVPSALLTAAGVSCLAAAKFLRIPAPVEGWADDFPSLSEAWRRRAERFLPTVMELLRRADAALKAHARFEAEVGGASARAFENWLRSGLKAAAYWVPVSLLAMLAGALAASPFQLLSRGLGLAETPEGRWLLRQSWPQLAGAVLAADVLQQVYVLGAFAGLAVLLKRRGWKDRAAQAAAAAGACCLAVLSWDGFEWLKAAPLLAMQLALIYAYARTRTLLVPGAAAAVLGLASLYSARMAVLLKADLGSTEALPGIPGAGGVLAVLGAGLVLFTADGRAQWERTRSLGAWWRRPAEVPKSPLALAPLGALWGLGVYLAGYLSYYAVYGLVPRGETVPEALKRTLLMPLDLLAYVFFIGAALEELIFRRGLFRALAARLGFWPAAAASSAVFSTFHFIDLSVPARCLGLNVSKFVQSLTAVYGFSWAGFTGRVAAGMLLALLYERSGVLLIAVIAHFTSNLLEAVGLRWGLSRLLAAVVGIFFLQLAAARKER